MNSKSLVQSLLKVVQAADERVRFSGSEILVDFVTDIGIGSVQGKSVIFTPGQKERIRAWLVADGIDPSTAPDAWKGISRSAALDVGPDEKWARMPVRQNRVAIKTLLGQPMNVSDNALYLPPGSNLDFDLRDAHTLRHDAVIVVENWEAFERVDELKFDLDPAGQNPLVVWRGGGAAWSVGAAARFVQAFARPVWSAPDYDPAGLAIAARLPRLAGILAPPDDVLKALLKESKLHTRFLDQLHGATPALESATHADVKRLWSIVKASRSALPQERVLPPGTRPMG